MKNKFYLYRKAWRFDGAPHEEPQLQEQEWKELLKQEGLLVRNTYTFDCQENTSFWYLIKDHFEGLEELSGNTRKKVRRSLEKIEFRKVDNAFIKQNGYPILRTSFDDYLIKRLNGRTIRAEIKIPIIGGCLTKTIIGLSVFLL